MAEDTRASLEDAARVRAVLSRELETISHYESMARSATTAEVRDFLLHLAQEEKEHVAEGIAVLSRLDSIQAAHLGKPIPPQHFAPAAATVPAGAHLPGATVSRPPRDTHDPRLDADPRLAIYTLPAPPVPQGRADAPLTVGHLKGAP